MAAAVATVTAAAGSGYRRAATGDRRRPRGTTRDDGRTRRDQTLRSDQRPRCFRIRPQATLPGSRSWGERLARRLVLVGVRADDRPRRPVAFWDVDGRGRYRLHRITRIRRDWFDGWRNHCYEVEADGRVYYLIRHLALSRTRYGRAYWLLVYEKAPPSL